MHSADAYTAAVRRCTEDEEGAQSAGGGGRRRYNKAVEALGAVYKAGARRRSSHLLSVLQSASIFPNPGTLCDALALTLQSRPAPAPPAAGAARKGLDVAAGAGVEGGGVGDEERMAAEEELVVQEAMRIMVYLYICVSVYLYICISVSRDGHDPPCCIDTY